MIRRLERPAKPAAGTSWDVGESAGRRLKESGCHELRTITCHYHEGMVFLRGRVNSYYLKQLAQETIRNVAGVEQIVNEIEVVFPEQP